MSNNITDTDEQKNRDKLLNRRVHMANERTFLAWIRTSIGIMAFGFVVEKFALFMKQMSFFVEKSTTYNVQPPSPGYSAILGIFLVGLGTLIAVLAFIRYKKVAKQIDNDTWQRASFLDLMLTISVLAIGISLVAYLIYSI